MKAPIFILSLSDIHPIQSNLISWHLKIRTPHFTLRLALDTSLQKASLWEH